MRGAGAVHGEDLKACVLMEELLVGEHAVVSEITFPADRAGGQVVGVAVILLDLERAVETPGHAVLLRLAALVLELGHHGVNGAAALLDLVDAALAQGRTRTAVVARGA
jgi:hypothetical protein